MKRVCDSSTRRGVAVLAMALVLAGCGGTVATPVVVHVTPTPAATSTATPAPTQTATPAAISTPAPTATPTTTPTPAASPTCVAAACTGTADLKALFVEGASVLTFNVYCAVLPSDWSLQYVRRNLLPGLPAGGILEAGYKGSGGATLLVREGLWCPPDPYMVCTLGATIGPASFGSLTGTLYLNNTTYSLRVYTDPAAYLMVGSGMDQAQFVAWAAALVKVPKP